MRLNLLLHLAIGLPMVLCGHCPRGSVDSTVDGQCVMAIENAVTFSNAKQICISLSGNLIKIQNGFQNALAAEQLGDANIVTPAFIGVVRDDSTQQWTYVDGSPLTYNRWKPGSILNGTSGKCAEMSSDVYWHPVSCDKPRSLICTFPDNLPDPICGQNWTYSETFNACYYLQAPTNVNFYTFNTSLDACRVMGSDLISIHSQQENDFVMNFIATHASGIDCINYGALIGLTMINGVQAWTDGTPFDYDNRGSVNQTKYAMINETGCSSAQWNGWTLGWSFQRFLCKKAPSSLRERISEIIASLDDKIPNKQ